MTEAVGTGWLRSGGGVGGTVGPREVGEGEARPPGPTALTGKPSRLSVAPGQAGALGAANGPVCADAPAPISR